MKSMLAMATLLALAVTSLHAEGHHAEGWHGSIGVMSLSNPEYSGGENNDTQIFPFLDIKYKDVFFASVQDGIGYNAIHDGMWRAGPVVKVNFGRDADDATELAGLGDIDATAEVGAFIEKTDGKFKTKLEVRQALGGHEGLVADAEVKYQDRVGRTLISVGPSITYGDSDYMNAFYGISTAQAASSAYSAQEASSGLASYGVSGVAIHPLDDKWSLTALAGYDRLAGDAKDSALTRDADQFTFGLGLGYRF